MKRNEIAKLRFIASQTGGDIRCVDTDGILKWELGLQSAILKGADLLAYVGPDDLLDVKGGVYIWAPDNTRLKPQPATDVIESGANPDFQPTTYTDAELRMRKMMSDVQKQSDMLERRRKSFEEAEAKRKAQEEADAVLEPDPVEPDPVEPEPETT